jgi:hypothetical protein
MKTTDLLIAVNTVWVAQNGGTHGSLVGPLLHPSVSVDRTLGSARAEPHSARECAWQGETEASA